MSINMGVYNQKHNIRIVTATSLFDGHHVAAEDVEDNRVLCANDKAPVVLQNFADVVVARDEVHIECRYPGNGFRLA